jgi:hypothetical protein
MHDTTTDLSFLKSLFLAITDFQEVSTASRPIGKNRHQSRNSVAKCQKQTTDGLGLVKQRVAQNFETSLSCTSRQYEMTVYVKK